MYRSLRLFATLSETSACEHAFRAFASRNPQLNAIVTPMGPFLEKNKALNDSGGSNETQSNNQFLSSSSSSSSSSTKRPLEGVTVAVKDNFCTKDVRTTCSSKILENFIPPYTATVVERLVQAGAIIVGKTNMDEFGMGSLCTNSIFGPSINPHGYSETTRYACGGSSGGSAVAVATKMASLALGSDTGGSVRIPAAYCGVVGWKPSYGRLSRFGLISYASSLDTPGVFGTSVRECALAANIMSGYDENDSSCLNSAPMQATPSPSSTPPLLPLSQLKVGVPQEYFITELSSESERAWLETLNMAETLGATIVPVSLPLTLSALSCYYVLALAEASSNLSRYTSMFYGRREGSVEERASVAELFSQSRKAALGMEVQRRILGGAHILSRQAYDSHYVKAQQVRRLICEEFASVFKDVHVLITPTTPWPAPPLPSSSSTSSPQEDPTVAYANDVFTVPASLAGLPALSLPVGSTVSLPHLPLAVQIIGKLYDESSVLRCASELENGLSARAKS